MHLTAFLLALVWAAIAAGALLRSTGLLNSSDAKAASLAITYATLPSLVFQTLYSCTLTLESVSVAAAAVALNLAMAATAWFVFRNRRGPERALLTGATVGTAVGSVGYAFAEATLGTPGLHFAVIWDLGNLLAVLGLSCAIFARAGSAFPPSYQHADGGTFRGQWQGRSKHGLGVYAYPGGARYEGQWADNLKEGLGVYYYPKGGWYEGQWHKGERSGVGLRIMSSGAVQAGRWKGLNLAEKMEEAACAFVASSSRDVAQAAKKVKVGGGTPGDIAQDLLNQPMLWAAAAAVGASLSGYRVSTMANMVTAHLASAHVPLSLLLYGLSLQPALPKGRGQVPDVRAVLALRTVLPLVVAAGTAWLAPPYLTSAVATAVICAASPIPETVTSYAIQFRLNEAIAARIASCARLAALPLLSVLSGIIGLLSQNLALDSKGARPLVAMALAGLAALVALIGGVVFRVLEQMQPSNAPRVGSAGSNPAPERRPGQNMRVAFAASPSQPASLAAENSLAAADSLDSVAQQSSGLGVAADNELADVFEEASQEQYNVSDPGQTAEGQDVQMGKADLGKGTDIGEASVVQDWDGSGNVLVGSQTESSADPPASGGTEDPPIDRGASPPGSGGGQAADSPRRRSRAVFEDVDNDDEAQESMHEGGIDSVLPRIVDASQAISGYFRRSMKMPGLRPPSAITRAVPRILPCRRPAGSTLPMRSAGVKPVFVMR